MLHDEHPLQVLVERPLRPRVLVRLSQSVKNTARCRDLAFSSSDAYQILIRVLLEELHREVTADESGHACDGHPSRHRGYPVQAQDAPDSKGLLSPARAPTRSMSV